MPETAAHVGWSVPEGRRGKTGAAVVLGEIAWVRRDDSRFWLYIRHPSRLQRLMRERLAARRLPAALIEALEAARRRNEAWNREMEPFLDAHWRQILEPPLRLVLRPDGSVERVDEVFGTTWAGLQSQLEGHASEARMKDQPTATPQESTARRREEDKLAPRRDDARMKAFISTVQNADSWVRLGIRFQKHGKRT